MFWGKNRRKTWNISSKDCIAIRRTGEESYFLFHTKSTWRTGEGGLFTQTGTSHQNQQVRSHARSTLYDYRWLSAKPQRQRTLWKTCRLAVASLNWSCYMWHIYMFIWLFVEPASEMRFPLHFWCQEKTSLRVDGRRQSFSTPKWLLTPLAF